MHSVERINLMEDIVGIGERLVRSKKRNWPQQRATDRIGLFVIVIRDRYLFKQTMKGRVARIRPSNDKSVASTHSNLHEHK